MSAGENHNLYISDSNSLYSSGNNVFGQLGIGEEETKSSHLNRIGKSEIRLRLEGKSFKAAACGSEHSVALNAKGELFTWGLNFRG